MFDIGRCLLSAPLAVGTESFSFAFASHAWINSNWHSKCNWSEQTHIWLSKRRFIRSTFQWHKTRNYKFVIQNYSAMSFRQSFSNFSNSVRTSKASRALCIFVAGVLLSASIHGNSKTLMSAIDPIADMALVMEFVKMNQNVAVGLVSGLLIGVSQR